MWGAPVTLPCRCLPGPLQRRSALAWSTSGSRSSTGIRWRLRGRACGSAREPNAEAGGHRCRTHRQHRVADWQHRQYIVRHTVAQKRDGRTAVRSRLPLWRRVRSRQHNGQNKDTPPSPVTAPRESRSHTPGIRLQPSAAARLGPSADRARPGRCSEHGARNTPRIAAAVS